MRSLIDSDTQAAKRFWRIVREFSERTRSWHVAVFYEVKPDEVFDPTLVSQRVYGRRDEFMAVMASAGIDTADQPLPQKQIVLPTEAQLHVLKRRAGFESMADSREGGKPTWAD